MKAKALVVGLNVYPDPDDELSGSVNDAVAIKKLLDQKFGFTANGIRVLTNSEATREAILEGLEWLAEGASAGTRRVFHYSGHGSRRADKTGDELDGWDECLVPYDYEKKGVLLDDTLGKAYKRIGAKTHLLLLMDCCHSGTIHKDPQTNRTFRFLEPPKGEKTRAVKAGVKARKTVTRDILAMVRKKAAQLAKKDLTKKDLEAAFSEVIAKAGARSEKKKFSKEDPPANLIMLAAAQDKETAAEDKFGSKHQGAMTHYLLGALRGSTPTYDALIVKIASSLEKGQYAQTPALRIGDPALGEKKFLLGR